MNHQMSLGENAASQVVIVSLDVGLTTQMLASFETANLQVALLNPGGDLAGQLKAFGPDVIILDLATVDASLIGVIRNGDSDRKTPVGIISLLPEDAGDERTLAAFEAGSDECQDRSGSRAILAARANALARRVTAKVDDRPKDEARLTVLDLVIDRRRFVVTRTGDQEPGRFNLPRKEFEVLYLLASRPGIVFSRDELLDSIWGEDIYVSPRTVDVHIRKIRDKIGTAYIETVTGVGYRFVDVEDQAD